jgi:hypothetical protein
MRIITLTARVTLLAATFVATSAPLAFAGGPLANCSSGVPFRWPAGGSSIPFNPDQGDLGPVAHAAAVAAVQDSFDRWGNVGSSTVGYTNAGELPVDVDITNFDPFLNPVAPDGLSAIVFDDTGEIFDLLFGPGSGILGFAGPEWINPSTCEILEGVSFLNGPSFTNLTAATDVMVHEFGHYSNLAHTAVNGQIFLDDDESGPTPFNTFGTPAGPAGEAIETMYPFYFGPGTGTQNLNADDIAAISTLYPAAGFFASTGTIAGSVLASTGITRLSGVNVIARNVANPFVDAVSAMSGDFTDSTSQADPVTGTYRLNGLTPGATYAVFVDQILAGGFSTPPITLPGAEEFYNLGESNNVTTPDDPSVFTGVPAVAGVPTAGISVIMNSFAPGDPLPVGDDGFVELALPFPFKMCGQEFASVFVNANGNLTFGAPSTDFSETVNELLAGPPRIAGVWDDLNPAAGGVVTFDQTANTFTVRYEDVPEFPATGSNTFSITLKRSANHATINYGDISALDGLAGLTCGGAVASGFENETNLRRADENRTINLNNQTGAFEIFTASDNDLDGFNLTFVNFKNGFVDVFERHSGNDDIDHARAISLPFSTAPQHLYSAIDPVGGDVDYYRFRARAGDILALEVVRGGFDSVLGVFDADTGTLLAVDDDGGFGGVGGLSRLLLQANVDLNLAVAVSAYPDLTFAGTSGDTGGRYVLVVNKYRGQLLAAGDDTATEVALTRPFRFQNQDWNSVFVNSNGSLTFGAGDTDFSESVGEFLARAPRIAPLWDDLDASDGLVIAEQGPHHTTIHFVSVPEFFSTSPNYFAVKLLPLGIVQVEYGATARSDSLVGVTQGAGAANPGETDLSARFLPIFSSNGTTYEQFVVPEPFDLSFGSLFFQPFF